jgi:hypothetical protein
VMETHLTEERYRGLVEGTLTPEEASALARHLDAPCQACEEFLAGRPDADALDGQVDRALAAAAPVPAAGRGTDLEFRRIQRAMTVRAVPGHPRGRWVSPTYRASLAAAAIVAVLGGLWAMEVLDRTRHPDWTGAKGMSSAAVPVQLRFLVDRGEVIDKGLSGQEVSRDDRLRFELTLAHDADVALVRVGTAGQPEVFYRDTLKAGSTLVSVEGKPAAYPLAGLEGPQRFVAVASPSWIDDTRAADAAAVLAPPARISGASPRLEGLTLDVVEVTVR